MVGINTVTVCNIERIKNTDVTDKHIITAGRVKCPEGSILDCDILYGNVIAVFDIDCGRAGVEVARYVILILSFNEGIAVGIDNTLTADYCTVCTVAVNKGKGGLTRYGVTYKSSFRVIDCFAGSDIGIYVCACLENSTLLKVKLNIFTKLN